MNKDFKTPNWNYILFVMVISLGVFSFAKPVFAAQSNEKYSPLFDASLQNTLREFDEKESGLNFADAKPAVSESFNLASNESKKVLIAIAYGIPKMPVIPSIPKIPTTPMQTYTSSYSCGATCSSTCGATCGSTCNSTCFGKSTCAGGSTCVGSSTCVGANTCVGRSTCAGGSTCVGTNTCIGMSTCSGGSTCFGTNTCSGTSTCFGSSTCINGQTCIPARTTTPIIPTKPTINDSLPETKTETKTETTTEATTSPPVDNSKNSSSTKISDWAKIEVEKAISLSFIPKDMQNNYQKNITRKEFCTLSIQFLKGILSIETFELPIDSDLNKSPFTDVDDIDVTLSYYLDIVSGIGNNKFNPDGQITRQEAAAMLTNMAKYVFLVETQAKQIDSSDKDLIAIWAIDSVNFVSEKGIMSSVGENKFAPKQFYTREQSFVTILRLYDIATKD